MKRVRCPKCDNFITFDETRYKEGQSLIFVCPECNKQFGIRIGISKLRDRQKEENPEDLVGNNDIGAIVVIENVFHYKQIIPLRMGDNVIGRYQKGNPINTPIETVDPSVDNTHCIINVSRDKQGEKDYRGWCIIHSRCNKHIAERRKISQLQHHIKVTRGTPETMTCPVL